MKCIQSGKPVQATTTLIPEWAPQRRAKGRLLALFAQTRCTRAFLVVSFLASLIAAAPARAQYVETAIALIQLVRSFQSTGSSSSWIKKEFDAINLKVDAVLENQERLAAGIQVLSEQIADLEKSFATEFNAKPFKEVLAQLIVNQAGINDLAKEYENVGALSGDLRTAGFQDIRRRLDLAKETLPDAFALLSGVDAAYGKLKLSAVSRIGLIHAQLVYSIALMDVLLDREFAPPADRIIWYVQKYSAIEQGTTRFLSEEALKSTRAALRSVYFGLETPVDNGVNNCFDPLQGYRGRRKENFLTVHELLDLEFQSGNQLSGALEHGQPRRNQDGIYTMPVDFELVCGSVATDSARLIDEYLPCQWYDTIEHGRRGRVWACVQKNVRWGRIFRERITLKEVTSSFLELVPERAVALMSFDGDEVWTLRFEASSAAGPIATAQLLSRNWGGVEDITFDRILEKDTDVDEKWIIDCIERRSDCARTDLAWTDRPAKFMDGFKAFAALSSAKALEIADFDRSVRELKKLRTDTTEEIRRISGSGHL
ncbi:MULTISPECIES: hypothetical protein [Bradyrhizobium]|uniref:hypothetical protein n=1 Tax=Bradyrhizobium TaxID=374 RepID=UPI000482384B|nr:MULTISPECIES: hypothetical protein [Bradyrhizobium]MBR1003236.1 hypothetical protein [Bradyrhizobium liaoningense]MCP1738244.1 hypothetical protein [Bradyrhizobium japonicum]MCP1856028.1 hypothetical protein [Bradyrhizobium japonicum]MCP1897157.1 hypothetical protein [Bradyrhizobium japonicum]MCW2330795.1 hypothetical protein [Bradyrhizobium japonicum]